MAPLQHAVSRMMRSLVMKFTVLSGVLLIAVTSVLMAIEYTNNVRENSEGSHRHAQLIAQMFAVTTAEPIAEGDLDRLNAQIRQFRNRPDVAGVIVTDISRQVLGSDGAVEFVPGSRAADHLVQSALGAVDIRVETTGGMIRVAQPVFHNGRLVGAV
jgi:HAMP domain-containing protein